MQPIQAGAPPGGEVVRLSDYIQGLALPRDEELAQLPDSLLPGDESLEIALGPEARRQLAQDLREILDAYDMSMPQRLRRWREIKEAYNLVPDPLRQGHKPDASRLVSEMTRSQVNTAASRLEESVLGVRPFIKLDVAFEGEKGEETKLLVEQARATEEFFEAYSNGELEVDRWVPDGIMRASKLGTAVLYVQWKKEKRTRHFRAQSGKREKKVEEHGRIQVSLVPNENVVVWPIHETDVQRHAVFGHRTFYSPAEFRAWARGLGIGAEEIARIIAAAAGDQDDATKPLEHDLAGKDIHTSGYDPFKGQVQVTELWCHMALPGEGAEPTKFQVFLHERSPLEKAVLWLGHWAFDSGKRPYFAKHYWREDGSFWGSGVGHELVYAQAADSALWNLLIDNLKIIANHIRILKSGSAAEALQDQIGPGYNLVTEDPEKDVRIVPLGGDLKEVHQAISANEMRGMKGTGVTPPLQGMGDPVLKSGASPSSLQMLINEANQKFGKVDKNMRRCLSDMFAFFLDLIQQYAPDGLFYTRAPEEQADQIRRLRYAAPPGDLSRMFRIRVEAPTATSNREVLKQNLMVIYQLTQAHVEKSLMLAGQVLGQKDPAGFEQFQRELLELSQELYRQVVKLHEVPGIGTLVPDVPEPTPEHELINQLQATVADLTQKLQAMQAAMQGGAGGPAGQQQMGPPGAQPGLQGPVPAPQGAGAPG